MSSKPKWWLLYAVVPLMIGLLWLASQLAVAAWMHQVAQMAIVLLAFSLLALWVHANQGAVANEPSHRDALEPRWTEEGDSMQDVYVPPATRYAHVTGRAAPGATRYARAMKGTYN